MCYVVAKVFLKGFKCVMWFISCSKGVLSVLCGC